MFKIKNFYQATIKCNDSKYKQKRYKGNCQTTFEKRYAKLKFFSTQLSLKMTPLYQQNTGIYNI